MNTIRTKLFISSVLPAVLIVGGLANAQGPSKSNKRFEGSTFEHQQPSPKRAPPSAAPQPTTTNAPAPAPMSDTASSTASASASAATTSSGSFWSRRHIGLSARAGTLGFGAELSTQLIQNKLNLRTGFNTFSYDYEAEGENDGTDNELEYDGELDFSNLPLLFDWHPFGGGLRATAGVVFNNNEINANARCNQASCEFGDQSFNSNIIGTTTLNVDLGGTQPYLGIGWGNAVHSVGRWSFAFDLGVVFQDVEVNITPSQTCAADPQCSAEVERERAELQEDAEDIDMYPVLSFGLSYKIR